MRARPSVRRTASSTACLAPHWSGLLFSCQRRVTEDADLPPLNEATSGARIPGGRNKGGQEMPRGKPEQAEQIIPKLREVEVELGRGKTVAEAVKKIGVTEQTYYRWKKKFGGLRIDQAKRLKELEKENSRLKRLLADAELDKAILREVAEGKF